MTDVSYTQARANLATLMDRVVENRETIIIERRGSDPVALVAASELQSIVETAHLLRSPANAERLLRALDRARRGTEAPSSLEALERDLDLFTVR